MTIAVVNCGIGNCGSVVKMLSLFTHKIIIVNEASQLKHAKKIVLPGVGAFDQAMKELESKGFIDMLDKLVLKQNIPILGICLGMQLLCSSSEEGDSKGLGWIQSNFKKFISSTNQTIKIPHMGWNKVNLLGSNLLFKGISEDCKFYFAHSFYMEVKNKITIGVTSHGNDFSSAIVKDNIYGVQFHPEKSHRFGKALMKNFVEI